MTDNSYFCTRLDRLCALERNIFYERSISKKQLLLEIIEKIGCTKSIQPSKELRIVGHSVLDWKTLSPTIHTDSTNLIRMSTPHTLSCPQSQITGDHRQIISPCWHSGHFALWANCRGSKSEDVNRARQESAESCKDFIKDGGQCRWPGELHQHSK